MTDIDRYTAHYDGDLRIFLHQLCEISAILGTPYDGAFDLAAGRFDWNRGAVLHAGPGRRSVLVVTDQHGDVTLARLIEFCMRCSIRMKTIRGPVTDAEELRDIDELRARVELRRQDETWSKLNQQ